MRDMEDRMGRDGASYQDTIARLEADIAKMKVTISEVLRLPPLYLEVRKSKLVISRCLA